MYYATFTLASVIGGAIVYNEFEGISGWQSAQFTCGIICTCGGVSSILSGRQTTSGSALGFLALVRAMHAASVA